MTIEKPNENPAPEPESPPATPPAPPATPPAPAPPSNDPPQWATDLGNRLGNVEKMLAGGDDDSDEDDGILSVEELPDLIEDAVDAIKEASPVKEFGLFRRWWGKE